MSVLDTNGVRLELCGHPRLFLAEGRTLPLQPLDAALLALIALEGPVSRDRVLALLWADCSRKAAQGNLRQRLFRLRSRTRIDLVLSAEALELASGVEHDLGSCAPAERPFLGDFRFEANEELAEWVDRVRERRHREDCERLAAEASRLEAQGRLADAIALAERLVAREPTLEHAHRRAMRLHYRRGDRAAALQAYRRCGESLDRLLGAAPSAETDALAALIEQSRLLPDPSPAPPPVTLLRPPRLIGRQSAWRAWDEAWREGRLVVIGGEPGIGKSRLVEDFLAAHGADKPKRLHPGDARMPYATWARWLRDWRATFGPPKEAWVEAELARLVPGIGAESASTFAPLRFRQACFDALAEWFDHGLRSVVIDDLQHADEATLEILLAWCSQEPLQRLAMAVRSTEMPISLTNWLEAERGRERVRELNLQALGHDEIHELLESLGLPGLTANESADALRRRTGGNPFFVIETLRAHGTASSVAADDRTTRLTSASATLDRLLSTRLLKLPDEALRLASVASLAGTDFSAELAAATLGLHPVDLAGAWRVLEETQVFRNGAFVHDLMLESAATLVPAAIAKTLHAAIAKALDPARVAPARIAHHAYEGGDWSYAAAQFEAAAVEAFKAVRHREVVQFCDWARDCHERIGNLRAAFQIEVRAVESALIYAEQSFLEVRTLNLLEMADGESEEAVACTVRSKHLFNVFRMDECILSSTRALEIAKRHRHVELELEATGLLAVALCIQDRHEDGIEVMQGPAARFDSIVESKARNDFAVSYSALLGYTGRAVEAEHWCERGIRAGEQSGRSDDLAVEWANLALSRSQLGLIDQALDAGRHSLKLYARQHVQSGAPLQYARIVTANCMKKAGYWTEAESLLQEALAAAQHSLPTLLTIAESHLATLYLELGQYARARKSLATASARPAAFLRRAVIEARLELRTGEVGASERLAALRAEHVDGQKLMPIERLQFNAALALLDSAEAATRRCLTLRAETERLGLRSVCLCVTARLASAASEVAAHDEALKWARLALTEAADVRPFDMDAPELAWHIHQGLASRAPDEALMHTREALGRLRDCLPNMPEHYRDAYWNRSPFVPRLRALIAAM